MPTGNEKIPDGWRLVRLGDVATEVNDRANGESNADVYSVTKYDGFVRSLDYFDRQVFSRDTKNYKIVRNGDFAYATIHLDEGSLGMLRDADAALISPMYTVFRVDAQVANPGFLFPLMKLPNMVNRYKRIGEGSIHRRKSVNFERLSSLSIPLPPLLEQRAIAVVLDSIDEAIEGTEAVIAATEGLRDSLLHELLTRGVPGWHTEWKEVPGIGIVPESWEVVRLGDVLETTTYGTNVPHDGGGRVPILRMNNLQDGEIDLTEVRSADLANEDLRKLSLVPGDILFNRTNSLDLVGKVAVVRNLPQPISFASYLVRLRVQQSRANPFWLSSLLGFPSCQSRIRKFATPGVSQANINPTSLKSLLIPLPSLLEQQAIAALLDGVDDAIKRAHEERNTLQSLKASAADALLTGQVRVRSSTHSDTLEG